MTVLNDIQVNESDAKVSLPVFIPDAPCQCNPQCLDIGDCCGDYEEVCLGGSSCVISLDGSSWPEFPPIIVDPEVP